MERVSSKLRKGCPGRACPRPALMAAVCRAPGPETPQGSVLASQSLDDPRSIIDPFFQNDDRKKKTKLAKGGETRATALRRRPQEEKLLSSWTAGASLLKEREMEREQEQKNKLVSYCCDVLPCDRDSTGGPPSQNAPPLCLSEIRSDFMADRSCLPSFLLSSNSIRSTTPSQPVATVLSVASPSSSLAKKEMGRALFVGACGPSGKWSQPTQSRIFGGVGGWFGRGESVTHSACFFFAAIFVSLSA